MSRRLRNFLRLTAMALLVAVVPRCFADDPLPDPQALLRGVEQDRLAIVSGRMKMDVTETSTQWPHEPARARIVVEFDGVRLKVDQDRRSLRIDWIHGGAGSFKKLVEKRNRLLASWGGGPEAIVREGLGYWLDTHSRVILDGTLLMKYSPGSRAFVKNDTRQGTGDFLIDPRTLGLSSSLSTLGRIFTTRADETVSLVGREKIGGVSTWHVLIGGGARGIEHDFWIEPPPGHRVYKTESRLGRNYRFEITSEYDPRESGDAGRLPFRVKAVAHDPNGDRELVIERSPGPESVEFNVAIDPGTWTLAGLEMPIGEPVSDQRAGRDPKGRDIRYWDGKTLSETPIPRPSKEAVAAPRPTAAKLLEVARRDPTSPLAVDAVAEIASFTPSAPENREALELLTRDQPGGEGVGAVGLRMIDRLPESAEALFRAILARNSHREDLGLACLGLAEILKARSERTGQVGNDEAEQLLGRVMESYGDLRRFGSVTTIGESAKQELTERLTLGIGNIAPVLVGRDLDDQPLKLSDYRGKVVVVNFWAITCGPCLEMVPRERELVARMKDKPFALLGVNCDDKRLVARAAQEKASMSWPSWWFGENLKSVGERWGVHFLPTIYVLDAKGVIRFKNLRGEALDKAVDSLVKEATP